MVVVQALLAMVLRSAGRLLNTAFGWATVMLFGRVPQDRQIYLSLVSFGSVIWLVTVAGIAFPTIATFILSFVPLPEWIDRTWVRLAMLGAALIIPAIVGGLAVRLVDAETRPRGAGGVAKTVLRGYPYTIGLSLTLILMTVFAPVLKVRDLFRRWTTQHVPVMVEPQDYAGVVDDIDHALRDGGMTMTRGRPSWMLRLPTRLLGWFAGAAVGDLVAEQLTRLYAPNGEVLLHPSDLVISGRAADASRMRAIIAERVTFSRAYLTWDAEANGLEDALRRVWEDLEGTTGIDALARLRALARRMDGLTLPYEEWEVLFRQKLQVERAALRRVAGLDDRMSTGVTEEPDAGALGQAVAAVAGAAAQLVRSWRAERRDGGLSLMPFVAAATALGAAFRGRRRAPTARGRADLPMPDAHVETRYPKAA